VPASECDPLANGIDLSLLEHTAQSNRTMSCSTANISSIGSSSASAVAQKGSSLAYKITRISLVPFHRMSGNTFPLRHCAERSIATCGWRLFGDVTVLSRTRPRVFLRKK
jgi:hypothetical protein